MSLTVDAVIDALRPVEDPELHRSIVDLGMVRDVRVDGNRVSLEVTLTVAGNAIGVLVWKLPSESLKSSVSAPSMPVMLILAPATIGLAVGIE